MRRAVFAGAIRALSGFSLDVLDVAFKSIAVLPTYEPHNIHEYSIQMNIASCFFETMFLFIAERSNVSSTFQIVLDLACDWVRLLLICRGLESAA
jgi:hypothetical protein